MPTIDMIATGTNIKRLMMTNHMTVANIQAVFGFATPQAIYKWLRGDSLPTIDNLVILADIFGVTMDEIVIVRRNEHTAAA